MHKKAIPALAWFIPLIPISLAAAIYFGELQSSSFLFINRFTQQLPDFIWAWLTFLGNGWGLFAISFPLLLLAPRLFTAGIFAGVRCNASYLFAGVYQGGRVGSRDEF